MCVIQAIICLSLTTALHAPLQTPDPSARIAVSADGNYGDADDWGATPLTLSIIFHSGFKDRLVHYDYCSVVPSNNPIHEAMMERAALEGAEKFGYDKSKFFNAHRNVNRAANNIAKEIDASSADSKLVFLLAGAPEVLWQGVNRSALDKRKHVNVISHGRFDGPNNDPKRRHGHSAEDVIALGVKWTQISDQNKDKKAARTGFATGTMTSWEFLRQTVHGQWVYQWIDEVDSREGKTHWGYRGATGDASDAGLAFYYFTGDQDGNVAKLKNYLLRRNE